MSHLYCNSICAVWLAVHWNMANNLSQNWVILHYSVMVFKLVNILLAVLVVSTCKCGQEFSSPRKKVIVLHEPVSKCVPKVMVVPQPKYVPVPMPRAPGKVIVVKSPPKEPKVIFVKQPAPPPPPAKTIVRLLYIFINWHISIYNKHYRSSNNLLDLLCPPKWLLSTKECPFRCPLNREQNKKLLLSNRLLPNGNNFQILYKLLYWSL